VQADAYPDRRFQARVVRVAPEAVKEQNVTSFQVRLRLLDGLATLKSGMNVDLVFQGQRLPSALTVPTVAIVTREGKPGVLIPDAKGQPEFRPVTLGVSLGNRTQILGGLTPAQRVFIDLPKGSDWEKQRR
jgi:HlyD family secretion protein